MRAKTSILIADDNKEFANILKEFLGKYDEFDIVDVANDGNEAIEKILDKKPDVVVLDIIMPFIDGIGVMQKINESPARGGVRIKHRNFASQYFGIFKQ